MLSMSRRANGARWLASNSLKFRVGSVFVNGKMTVSLPNQELCLITKRPRDPPKFRPKAKRTVVATRLFQMGLGEPREPM